MSCMYVGSCKISVLAYVTTAPTCYINLLNFTICITNNIPTCLTVKADKFKINFYNNINLNRGVTGRENVNYLLKNSVIHINDTDS